LSPRFLSSLLSSLLSRFLSCLSITMRLPQCPILPHVSIRERGCLLQVRLRPCRRPASRFLRPQVLRCPTRVAGSPHLRAQPVVETRLLQVKLRAVPAALLQREDGHRWVAVRDSRFQEQVRGPVVALADVPVVAPADAGRLVARVADVAVAKNSSRWACRATRQTTQPFQTVR
jgi:hypothetical protein